MLLKQLENKKVVIWGTGREGTAAATYFIEKAPQVAFSVIDIVARAPLDLAGSRVPVVSDLAARTALLAEADVLIKSPGVSLYDPALEKERARGLCVTSLLNLWRGENPSAFLIGVTGTKGKSTTATLLGHVLNALGHKAAVLGNIGVPVTQSDRNDPVDLYVIEMSSYQTAVLEATFDLSLLTSLYPEHLDWHKTLTAYYRDKCNLLAHSDRRIVAAAAQSTLTENGIDVPDAIYYNAPEGWHFEGETLCDGGLSLGTLDNAYLMRAHNQANVCGVMTALAALQIDPAQALAAMASYQGLPHRQQELGTRDGILFVDDSISTTPQSAMAALDAYADHSVTLIAGGFDRGVDYAGLVDYLNRKPVRSVVCMGASGEKLFAALRKKGACPVFMADSMGQAVEKAVAETPPGGVVLLSPAAPSFGLFRDYRDRADCFAKAAGF